MTIAEMSCAIIKQDYPTNNEQVWQNSIKRICSFSKKKIHWQRNVWLELIILISRLLKV